MPRKPKRKTFNFNLRRNGSSEENSEENPPNQGYRTSPSQETLPSARPTRAANIRCIQNLSNIISEERSYDLNILRERARLRASRRVASESAEQRQQRLEDMRRRASQRVASEIAEQREQRLEDMQRHVASENDSSADLKKSTSCINMGKKKPPRKHPMRNSRSRAQRLRRSKEKEALMKLCKLQERTNKSFQDCSQEMANRDSVPTASIEILNPLEENKRASEFLENAIIIDSFDVIKTEILDPSEKMQGLIFQEDLQNVTTIDSSRKNTKLLLPDVKEELGSKTPFLDDLPHANRESASSKKENIGFNHTAHCNNNIRKNIPPIKPKSVCSCSEKIAMIKNLCESYLELVRQDDTNQLCLCQAGMLPKDMKPLEKLLKNLNYMLYE